MREANDFQGLLTSKSKSQQQQQQQQQPDATAYRFTLSWAQPSISTHSFAPQVLTGRSGMLCK
jgi:hypothetical protein